MYKKYNSVEDVEDVRLATPSSELSDVSYLTNEKVQRNSLYQTIGKISVAIIVLVSFIMIASRSSLDSSMSSTTSSFTSTSDDYVIDITVEDPDYGEIITLDYLPWDAVASPYRKQKLSISSFTVSDKTVDVTDYDVTWTLDGTTYSGSEINFYINKTGAFDCTVSLSSSKGRKLSTTSTTLPIVSTSSAVSTTYSYDFVMAAKYIRREIRSLTDSDRQNYFDAMDTMYTLSEEEGQALYGSKWHNAEFFSYKHLTGAGTTDCDHWHDGAGIVTHHMAFTLEVEQTLQAVNPSVAMAYWEYGMDTYLYDSWSDAEIFYPDWFGESSPTNEEHAIDDGSRWVGVEVPDGDPYTEWSISDTGSLNPYVNAFGHMRSPWNNNPIQLIGRHNQTYDMTQYDTMPSCSTLQSCYKSTTLADINDCSNGATHGPVHILIGGAWGQGNLFEDDDVTMAQMPDKLLFFKVLWRKGWSRCPDSCDLGVPCKCSVPQQYIDEYGAEYILKDTNIYYGLEKYLTDADDDLLLKVLRAVEDPGIAGEMFSSAAAFDPTFWPLHGQIERLLSLKRIMIEQGEVTDFDETWAFTDYNKYSGAAYLDGVCDWSKVAGSGDLTLPTCTMDVVCTGHNANDVLEFSGFLNEGDSYTNQEFYDFIHPWNDDLPYTYDTWDFDYCSDVGYPFTGSSSSSSSLPGSSTVPGSTSTVPSSGTSTVPGSTSGSTTVPGVPSIPNMQGGKKNRRLSVKSTRKMSKEEIAAVTNSRGQMLQKKMTK